MSGHRISGVEEGLGPLSMYFVSNVPGSWSHDQDARHSVSVIDIFRSLNQVVENLVNLEWDDDLQYAKFMTALANSIGKGVAQYCDFLEQMFELQSTGALFISLFLLNSMGAINVIVYFKFRKSAKRDFDPERGSGRFKNGEISLQTTLLSSSSSPLRDNDIPTL